MWSQFRRRKFSSITAQRWSHVTLCIISNAFSGVVAAGLPHKDFAIRESVDLPIICVTFLRDPMTSMTSSSSCRRRARQHTISGSRRSIAYGFHFLVTAHLRELCLRSGHCLFRALQPSVLILGTGSSSARAVFTTCAPPACELERRW
jgi:hypothetical protein